ncbi:MAG: hypothetical protein VX186_00350 [Nitrospinota bacterium]|nr:hypothetical protein [Nitrospinota bacterium]
MSIQPSDFSGSMIGTLIVSFFMISYCMGILVHSALMYEDKNKIGKDSRNGWILSMVAGTGITGWMFYYGYYMNFLR